MQKCYKFEFYAQLQRLSLAIKAPLQIQVFWKRGQKVAESGRVKLENCIAEFNKILTTQTSLTINSETQSFEYKKTKFSILLYGPQGTKQAGEIQFNLADYLNAKSSKPKKYQVKLEKCPDKNAKLTFSLTARMLQQVGFDGTSHGSTASVNIEAFAQNRDSKDKQNNTKSQKWVNENQKQNSHDSSSNNALANVVKTQKDSGQYIKQMQKQNNQMRERLKIKKDLIKENYQLQKKLKEQDFTGLKELRQKIQSGKRQLQALKSQISKNKNINNQIRQIQNEICKCKVQIMTAFNFAFQLGGSDLVDQLHESCGFRQNSGKQI